MISPSQFCRVTFACALLLLIAGGCSSTPRHYNRVTQIVTPPQNLSTKNGSFVSLQQVIASGDTGIGIMPNNDGVFVIKESIPYQIRANGDVRIPSRNIYPPIASSINFLMDSSAALKAGTTFAGLENELLKVSEKDNYLTAVRIRGRFASITLSAPEPGRLPDGSMKFRKWDLQKVSGTLIGFHFPAWSSEIHPMGFHLIFISDDLLSGGAVRDFNIADGHVEFDHCHEMSIIMPPK